MYGLIVSAIRQSSSMRNMLISISHGVRQHYIRKGWIYFRICYRICRCAQKYFIHITDKVTNEKTLKSLYYSCSLHWISSLETTCIYYSFLRTQRFLSNRDIWSPSGTITSQSRITMPTRRGSADNALQIPFYTVGDYNTTLRTHTPIVYRKWWPEDKTVTCYLPTNCFFHSSMTLFLLLKYLEKAVSFTYISCVRLYVVWRYIYASILYTYNKTVRREVYIWLKFHRWKIMYKWPKYTHGWAHI